MTSPTYLVGLDTLKADLHSSESVLAWRNGQCWQKCFSISLTLSNLFQNDLPTRGPLSHGCDGRIEVLGSWSRQSSYFLSRSGRVVCVLILPLFLYYTHNISISGNILSSLNFLVRCIISSLISSAVFRLFCTVLCLVCNIC